MKVRVFTLRMDPESGAFNDRALQDFQEGRDLLEVSEHAFHQDGVPFLVLVVRYREPDTARGRRGDEPRKDWRAELDDRGKVLYDELRLWRGRASKRDGLPPYLILSNREMAEIVMRGPTTVAALREVEGVGEAKAKRWGEEILAMVEAWTRAGAGDGGPTASPVDSPETSE